ncbi:ubiquitin carboxyl-terminal hydrolase 23-like [Curcuma longa]|uniref:ubiquitin carboxyl-terminal hydrolase 23-like n=1 Tax=Curcuma longa TaxID=136217 RepID=UPI003D9E15CE
MVAELNTPAPPTSPRPLPLLSPPLDLGLPPAFPLPFACPDLHICGSWNRIMEGTGKQTQALSSALLFLAAFVVLGTGSPACPVPSVGDSILGLPASCWDSMPSKGNRSVEAEFYEFGFDPELSCRITFRRIGAGLANLGNTCFLNSVLQCLTYTEPFAAYLQSGKHKSSCHTARFCAMCALQNHVITALQSSGKIVSPSHLVKNLRCVSRSFRNSRQEDAHEYMVNLLESMHKCCLPSGVPSESPSAYEKSLVHKIFGGRLQSQEIPH